MARTNGCNRIIFLDAPTGIKYYIDDSLVRSSTQISNIYYGELLCSKHGYGYENSIVYDVNGNGMMDIGVERVTGLGSTDYVMKSFFYEGYGTLLKTLMKSK